MVPAQRAFRVDAQIASCQVDRWIDAPEWIDVATADASARSAGRAPGGFDARVGRVLRSSRREVLLAMSIRSRATPTCSRGFGFRRAW